MFATLTPPRGEPTPPLYHDGCYTIAHSTDYGEWKYLKLSYAPAMDAVITTLMRTKKPCEVRVYDSSGDMIYTAVQG